MDTSLPSAGFPLGNIVGATSQELAGYSFGRHVAVVKAASHKAAPAPKRDRTIAFAEAAVLGIGAEHCPYCAVAAVLVTETGRTVPKGIVTVLALAPCDRDGVEFRRGLALGADKRPIGRMAAGVRTDLDHVLMHVNRATDFLLAQEKSAYLARQAKRSLAATIVATRESAALEAISKGSFTRPGKAAKRDGRRKGRRFGGSPEEGE